MNSAQKQIARLLVLLVGLGGGAGAGCSDEAEGTEASAPASAPSSAALPAEAPGTNEDFAFELSTTAPRSAVWAVWTDVTGWPRWDVVESARIEGTMTLGSRGATSFNGQESAFEVTEWSEGERYVLTFPLPDGALVIERSLAPGEATVFRHRVRFTGPGGPGVAAALGPGFRAALPTAMDRVRSLAEGR